jgi:hypothetical protein
MLQAFLTVLSGYASIRLIVWPHLLVTKIILLRDFMAVQYWNGDFIEFKYELIKVKYSKPSSSFGNTLEGQ